jgi:hypothetical protein
MTDELAPNVLTKAFWVDAKDRLFRTFVQVLVATLPIQTVSGQIFAGDWEALKALGLQALTAAGAASLSLLWSLIVAKKPGTISPASGAVVKGEVVSDELVDVTSVEAIEEYLNELEGLEVVEGLLPDEHTTAAEVETEPEPKGI